MCAQLSEIPFRLRYVGGGGGGGERGGGEGVRCDGRGDDGGEDGW